MDKFSPIDGLAEHGQRAARHEWNRRRLANIHRHVSAADVLARHGVSLQRNGTQAEQISCPFHGDDRRPSAKYFPEESDSRSHVWCFVCHERWDAVTLWKRFTGTEKFREVLWQMERAFGVTPPEGIELPEAEAPYDPLVDEVAQLFEVAERRLREYRELFTLHQHLKLGQLLDYTRYNFDAGKITLATAKERLALIHTKIKQRARAEASTDT